jgi:FAD/FMN-containing dehydrogenase
LNRRKFLRNAATISAAATAYSWKADSAGIGTAAFRRVRPGDPLWPSASHWDGLKNEISGRLIKVSSPLDECRINSSAAGCDKLFTELKNPYFIRDQPALTQTSGWVDAWSAEPSVYAVAAKNVADVAAAVRFATKHRLRVVVKGGGHSYQGTSNAPDSLLIWTREMEQIELHDAFIPKNGEGKSTPQPAVSVGAGCVWMQVYNAVTTHAGRYVQGGGCATVGVAGLIQSGGFGSFSKNYGLAAAGLIEAEIVTSDGRTRIVNEHIDPELFWALKGGGGGSFGVVTRLTLRTRELPVFFGVVLGELKASSDQSFRELIAYLIDLYRTKFFNPHWGEQIRIQSNNSISFQMLFQGLSQQEAHDLWQPLLDWVNQFSVNYEWQQPLIVSVLPARHVWDPEFLRQHAAQLIVKDDRADAPDENIFWKGDQEQAGQFMHGYRSAWLSASLLGDDQKKGLVNALFNASRIWGLSLHFNKGLAGAPGEEISAAKNTATNPEVLNAFALVIIAGESKPAFIKLPGHEPDLVTARKNAERINQSMDTLLKFSGSTGSYLSEGNFFDRNWQQAFWGTNYKRLSAAKKKYDPDGLFIVHHGVGSEFWTDDGFTRIG